MERKATCLFIVSNMSTKTSDLQKEAEYIKNQTQVLDELRKKHRRDILELLNDPEADKKVLVEILGMTDVGYDGERGQL